MKIKGIIAQTARPQMMFRRIFPKLFGHDEKMAFKGSFKVYALEGSGKKTKLKRHTVRVTGLVVDGVGYGKATCKKPAVSWTVTVK